jgi:hypothetical protein
VSGPSVSVVLLLGVRPYASSVGAAHGLQKLVPAKPSPPAPTTTVSFLDDMELHRVKREKTPKNCNTL